ncbi:hypothetical protein CONCODRAFT_8995 [Conidiobolus coronatus NRRL 28638]|uniref:Uncharacterized protein n=1 Tax=Conidiobolus coronatus (strain ATCC 28846 / CBS 209.66 / NRRL 28638) TaxID=796925 RepID=A0A137P1C4_CONC2|nr:hypothetical protein CONCODRAFT_8995 [Conidiobolus coronatus NRRL 28638]|eukprot:KXN68671.1 hypothetical protein CONCODRAFT_8995 [Conidiobolus coronatus NRRL 28638]
MAHARNVFKKSYVVQYVNFWPCGWSNENNCMSDTFVFAETHKIGLGETTSIKKLEATFDLSLPGIHELHTIVECYKGTAAMPSRDIMVPHSLTYLTDRGQESIPAATVGEAVCVWFLQHADPLINLSIATRARGPLYLTNKVRTSELVLVKCAKKKDMAQF